MSLQLYLTVFVYLRLCGIIMRMPPLPPPPPLGGNGGGRDRGAARDGGAAEKLGSTGRNVGGGRAGAVPAKEPGRESGPIGPAGGGRGSGAAGPAKAGAGAAGCCRDLAAAARRLGLAPPAGSGLRYMPTDRHVQSQHQKRKHKHVSALRHLMPTHLPWLPPAAGLDPRSSTAALPRCRLRGARPAGAGALPSAGAPSFATGFLRRGTGTMSGWRYSSASRGPGCKAPRRRRFGQP